MTEKVNKRVLIGLFGLARTFKDTSKLLFERIIYPNSKDYTFDIIINTDFENGSLTYGRGENGSSTANYKYDDIDLFKKDITECYNIHGQLKDIILFNKDPSFIIFPWFIVYKRIQQILQKSFENNTKYDVYIMMRMDIIVDTVHLNDMDNELLLVSGSHVREAYLHNRDIDFMMIGNYRPFMMWIYNTVNLFKDIVNKREESKGFFDTWPICSNELVDEFEKVKEICLDYDTESTIKRVGLHHLNHGLADLYILNNNTIHFDVNRYYQLEPEYLFEQIVHNIKLILHSHHFFLSENKNGIHSSILR